MSAAGDDTAWRTLVVFSAYRVVLALGLSGAYAFLNAFFQLGIQQPGLAVTALVTYAVASVLLVVPALLREPRISLQVTAAVFVDVLAIVVLMHTSGGIRSGIGVSLLISLAAAGLITRGRLVFFHAAVAALAILVEQAFQMWRFDAPASDFVQSGPHQHGALRHRGPGLDARALRAHQRDHRRSSAPSTWPTCRRSTSS